MKQTEIDKQRVLQDFVNREVIYCVSSLVYGLGQKLEVFEAFPDLFQDPPSYGDWECQECFHTWDGEPDAQVTCPECNKLVAFDDGFKATEYSEIYEHWIVSTWLANQLRDRGEAVEMDFYGLTVWGRTCTGQGIALDSVIELIYDDLHAND